MLVATGWFLLQAVGVSLSGVMAPGPITAATLAAGARRRHAGAWMAVGHGVVEFPLMGLIMAGAGVMLQTKGFRVGVGIAGGAILILMAMMMLGSLRRPMDVAQPQPVRNPLWTGMALTGANPYFLIWWATVGLALATRAAELGMIAFALFAVVHWLCNLAWLEVLSVASHHGTALMGPRVQKVIVIVCGSAMAAFGAWFLRDAIHTIGR